MEIVAESRFDGLNLLAPVPVLAFVLRTGERDGVSRALPGLGWLHANIPAFANAPDPNPPDIAPLALIARIALALQRRLASIPSFSRLLPHAPGQQVVVFAFHDSLLGSIAGNTAIDMVSAMLVAESGGETEALEPRLEELLAQFSAQARQGAMNEVFALLGVEARRRGIPWFRLNVSTPIVQFGHGRKAKRFKSTMTSETSEVAVNIATNKAVTAGLLRDNGVPVPRHVLVSTAENAVKAARSIGYPVVVKPNATDKGTAVARDLADDDAVRRHFPTAHAHGQVLVEEQIAGFDHRMTVLKGRMVAATREINAHVVGDGVSTVQALIDRLNEDPQRGEGRSAITSRLVVDDDITGRLASQGATLDTVPAAGQTIMLRDWWRHSFDHFSEDVTETMHPETKAMIERAVQLVGLDLAGVDFICRDVTRSWREVGGAINDVNPLPGLRSHVRAGTPDILRIVMEAYFPPGDDGRIPLAAVAGGSPRLIGYLRDALTGLSHVVAAATADGVFVGDMKVADAAGCDAPAARIALNDPTATLALLQADPRSVARHGFGFDRTTVSAVLGVPAGDSTAAEIARRAHGLMLGAAGRLCVLDADRPECVALASLCPPGRLCWITADPAQAHVAAHLAKGHAAIVVAPAAQGHTLSIRIGDKRHRLLPLSTSDGIVDLSPAALHDLAAAAAILMGLGLSGADIAARLQALNGGSGPG